MKIAQLTVDQVSDLRPPRQVGPTDEQLAPYLKALTPVQMGAGLKLSVADEDETKDAKRGFNAAAKRLDYEVRWKEDSDNASVLYLFRIDPATIVRRNRKSRDNGTANGSVSAAVAEAVEAVKAA